MDNANLADTLIAQEVATQDRMWGEMNERADTSNGQLLAAGAAQAIAILSFAKVPGPRELHFSAAKTALYPSDWSGFRDYGSDVANLVVAAAFLRQEIKRRIANGESTERSKRQPDQGYVAETGLPKEAA